MKAILILLIGLMLYSCGKKRSIVITAKNAATGVPYAGLEYYVSSFYEGSNGTEYKKVKSGYLNEQGEASFTMRESNWKGYVVRVIDPPNVCYTKYSQIYFGSPSDNNGHFDFEFAECAYLKLNINNVNCQGATDYFKLYYLGRQVGGQGQGIIGAISKEGGGCYSFLASDFSSVPMGEIYWKWEVTRNSVINTFYDTIYLARGEYKTYDVNY